MSVAGMVAVVSPIRSAARAQPLPRVRAMSCLATPVASAISAAARAANSNGSVFGSSSGWAWSGVVVDMRSTLFGLRMGENRHMAYEFERTQRIAVLGGGPGGY